MRIAHCLLPASVHNSVWADSLESSMSSGARVFDDIEGVRRFVQVNPDDRGEGSVLSLLQITLPDGIEGWRGTPGTAWSIPARFIRMQEFDVDALSVYPVAKVPRLEATSAQIEMAREFVFQQWAERSADRYPNRSLPIDLSGSCKFSSAFAQALFGGRLGVNERHQFLVLPGGDVLDLNAGSQDTDQAFDPYEDDLTMHAEPEWQEAMASIEPRVSDWTHQFMRTFRPAFVPGPWKGFRISRLQAKIEAERPSLWP